MRRFILQENVRRLHALLSNTTDDARRAQLSVLLAEAENELAIGMDVWRHTSDLNIPRPVSQMLEDELEEFVERQHAAYGSLHLYNGQKRILYLVAQLNFSASLVHNFGSIPVRDGGTVCAKAAALGESIYVPDLHENGSDYPLTVAHASGNIRAVQSTPVFGKDGNLLGVFSSHYAGAHDFGEEERMNCAKTALRLRPLMERALYA